MSRMVKKTIVLNQDHIDEVRKIFVVRTDKEAVNRALEIAVSDAETIDTRIQQAEKEY